MYLVALGKSETKTPKGIQWLARKIAFPRKDLNQETNPYGSRVLELSDTDYAIHGTPDEHDLGTNISKGCIRMKNADIIELYAYIPPNTTVQIIENTSEDANLYHVLKESSPKPSVMFLSPKQLKTIVKETDSVKGYFEWEKIKESDLPVTFLPKIPRKNEQITEKKKWKSRMREKR